MAHKHNRRRSRPRVRQNRTNYYTNNMSYDTLSLPYQHAVAPPSYIQSLQSRQQSGIPQYISGVTNWQDQPRPTTRSLTHVPSPKNAINVASERIKMFGGESDDSDLDSDDISLCFKMVEAFESMDWVNV